MLFHFLVALAIAAHVRDAIFLVPEGALGADHLVAIIAFEYSTAIRTKLRIAIST